MSTHASTESLRLPTGPGHLRSASSPNVVLPTQFEDLLEEENRVWAGAGNEDRPRSADIGSSKWVNWMPNMHRSRPGTSSTRSRKERNTESPTVLSPQLSNEPTDHFSGLRRDPSWDQGAMLRGTGSEFHTPPPPTVEIPSPSTLQTSPPPMSPVSPMVQAPPPPVPPKPLTASQLVSGQVNIDDDGDEDEEAIRFAAERELAIEISIREQITMAEELNLAEQIRKSGPYSDVPPIAIHPPSSQEFMREVPGQHQYDVWSPFDTSFSQSSSVDGGSNGKEKEVGRDVVVPATYVGLSEEEQLRILLERSRVEQ